MLCFVLIKGALRALGCLLGELEVQEVDRALTERLVVSFAHLSLQVLDRYAVNIAVTALRGHLHEVHVLLDHQLLDEFGGLRVSALVKMRIRVFWATLNPNPVHI